MGYLVSESTETGDIIKDYIWTEGMTPVAQIDNTLGLEQGLYLTTDHLMTNRIATDEFQSIVWRWEGEAFGNTPAEELAGFSINLRFPGQYFDVETNLHYNWHRYYDPVLGRYITSDPIGLSAGINTYVYVGNDPLSFIDIFGLDATNWWNKEGGRSPTKDGPSNGNWGGKCWSGGQYSCGDSEPGTAPPTDSADECYMYHDRCYVVCENDNICNRQECIDECDRELVRCLRDLDNDPRNWPQPPNPGTEGDTKRYKWAAEKYFGE